jgi:hypothetical protein
VISASCVPSLAEPEAAGRKFRFPASDAVENPGCTEELRRLLDLVAEAVEPRDR